jgi:hypothetical protein
MARKSRSALLAVMLLAGAAAGTVVACGGDSSESERASADGSAGQTGEPDATASDAGPIGDGASDGDAQRAPDGPCASDEDCVLDQSCLFPVGAACGSTGTCMTVPENGPGCAEAGSLDPTQQTSCSCDGSPRYQPCALPAGYTRGDIVHPGPCADGGQVCDPAARDCPDQQICGFRVSDGCSVTTAHCFDGPDPTSGIPGVLLEVCGCDGGVGSTFPDTELYVTIPVPELDSCRIVDAGADADATADASDASDAE